MEQSGLRCTQQKSPELFLVNIHDRSSAYQLHAGIFRFVCSNGMILADSVFARIIITHLNFEPTKVIERALRWCAKCRPSGMNAASDCRAV